MTYEELAYMGVIPANNELYHHGILGMRWGRKNGPPYPLPNSRHSSSEKRAGWKDSLTSVAKATGKGVAALAKGTVRAVKGTVGGVNRASIRLGLKPKKMMTNEELDAEIERIRKEDILKHLRGKKTDSDRLAIKLDKKSKRREMMKNVVQETLKTIGTKVIGEGLATDLKNRLNLASNKRADKYAVERAELYPDFDFGKEKGKKKDKGNTQPSDSTTSSGETKTKEKSEGNPAPKQTESKPSNSGAQTKQSEQKQTKPDSAAIRKSYFSNNTKSISDSSGDASERVNRTMNEQDRQKNFVDKYVESPFFNGGTYERPEKSSGSKYQVFTEKNSSGKREPVKAAEEAVKNVFYTDSYKPVNARMKWKDADTTSGKKAVVRGLSLLEQMDEEYSKSGSQMSVLDMAKLKAKSKGGR